MKSTLFLALGFFIVQLTAHPAHAAPPQTMNYQGVLKSSAGVPYNGFQKITFRIYNSPTAGKPLWAEIHPKLTIAKGQFSVTLGEGSPAVPIDLPFDLPYWLGITVDPETAEMTPRQPLTTAPYAFRAVTADIVPGLALVDGSITPAKLDTAYVMKAGDDMTGPLILPANGLTLGTNQLVTSNGNVGIGTAAPTNRLRVIDSQVFNDNPGIYGEHAATDNYGVGVMGKGGWKGVEGLVTGTANATYYGVRGEAASTIAGASAGTTVGGLFLARGALNDYGIQATATTTNASGSTYGGYFSASGGTHNYGIFATGGKNYLQGSVGLGTTAPGARLHLKGNGFPDSFMYLDTNAAGQDSGLRFYENGVDTSHLFWSAPSQNLKLYGKGYAGLDVTSTGNIGIGTQYPAEKLHVWGNYLRVEGGGSEQAYIGGDGFGGDVQIGSMNAAFSNVAMYNPASGKYMSVYLKDVHVMGGADLAEPFDSADAGRLQPGMVMVIDSAKPGQLILADTAYDRRVAGIVSGANGIRPGVTMAQEGSAANGTVPVALTGRVYAWADASYAAIEPGDLLTTSDTPGHAMRVSDYTRAQGAIIGKAMSRLIEGKGLVLVLVTLQ